MSGLRQQITDAALWEAIKRDDEVAFEMLYDRYWSKIYSTAFSYLHNREDSSEIVHDIFISIWMKRQHLDIHSLPNYLTAAARYQVYKRLQQRKSVRLIYSGTLEETDERPSVNQGEEHLLEVELQENMENNLKALPERCREIFLLSRKDHLSISEISERLGISKRTVENQLTRALHHLRHSLGIGSSG
jgi:RNA polymerase sigma-70 factor (family 1)